jgi:hypothetical protein
MEQDTPKTLAIENVLAMLEASKEKDGYTFMDHLTEMFSRILKNPKEHPLDKFEELSYLVKMSRMRVKQPLTEAEVKALRVVVSDKQAWINKCVKHIGWVCESVMGRTNPSTQLSR